MKLIYQRMVQWDKFQNRKRLQEYGGDNQKNTRITEWWKLELQENQLYILKDSEKRMFCDFSLKKEYT